MTNVLFLVSVVIFPIAGLFMFAFCGALCLIQLGYWKSIRKRDSLRDFFEGIVTPEENALRRSFKQTPLRYWSVLVTSVVIGLVIASLHEMK